MHLQISPIETNDKCADCVTEVPGPKYILVFGIPHALNGFFKELSLCRLAPALIYVGKIFLLLRQSCSLCISNGSLALIFFFFLGWVGSHITLVENSDGDILP